MEINHPDASHVGRGRLERISSATWLPAVIAYFVFTVLKSGALRYAAPEIAWDILQFTPILLAVAAMVLGRPRRKLNRRRMVVAWAALAFFVAAVVSLPGSIAIEATFAQLLILALMMGFILLTYAHRWESRERIESDLLAVLTLIVINQVIGLAGAAFGANWAIGDFYRFTGTTSNANFAGMLSAIGLAVGVALFTRADKPLRAFIGGAGVVLIVSLLLSGSRGSMVGVLVGVLVLLVARRNWRTLLSVVAALLVGAGVLFAFAPNVLNRVSGGDLTSGRVGIYATVIEHWLGRPVAGNGFRTTQEIAGTFGLEAHNIFLSVLVETGAVGLIAFVFLLGSIFFKGRANLLAGAAVTVVVIELTESSLFGWGGPTALFSWLILFAYAKYAENSAPIGRLSVRRAATVHPVTAP